MAVSFRQSPRRILVRGVNWLGDAVMTTPALIRLRERFPEAHITLLTPEKLRELWLRHPALDDVVSFDANEGLLAVGRKLRVGEFDLALVFPNSPRSALEVWVAGISQRVGYSRPWRNSFLTQTVPTRSGHMQMQKRTPAEIRRLVGDTCDNQKSEAPILKSETAHQIHEYLHLVAALGANPEPVAPQLCVDKMEVLALDWALPQSAHRAEFVIGLNPGAEYGAAKRWPIERFAQVANELYQKISCEFLIFGGKGDVGLAEQLLARLPGPVSQGHAVSLAGKTSLRDLMVGLKLCRVLLTNDTGPMHVAAAPGAPVVVPFGSTSPELTGPGLPGDAQHQLLKANVACAPCFLRECPIDFRCMNGITVERVAMAMLEVLGE